MHELNTITKKGFNLILGSKVYCTYTCNLLLPVNYLKFLLICTL